MKTEEMDRLFRAELETLEHVPGMEWNGEGAWNKINSGIKGGGHFPWSWVLSGTVVLVGVGLFFLLLNTPKKNKETAPVKNNYVKEMPEQKVLVFPKEEKTEKTPRKIVLKTEKVLAPIMPDTITSATLLPDTLSVRVEKKKPYRRYEFFYAPMEQKKPSFSMPSLSFHNMKVNNALNFSNLEKSLRMEKEMEDNRYYFYEYNKNYVPYPHGMFHQKYQPDHIYLFEHLDRYEK